MATRAALPRPQRRSQSTGVWELLGPPFPLSCPLQIPSEVAAGACLSLCSASCLAQPPACPQFSLPSVLMFKRGCVAGGYECLVTGKGVGFCVNSSLSCPLGAWRWTWLWVMTQKEFLALLAED